MNRLVAALLALLGLSACADGRDLQVDKFAELVETKAVVLLDVRTAEEYDAGHLRGAVNVDMREADFVSKIERLVADKDAQVAVYCRSGRRSAAACTMLEAAGYKHLYNLEGGILAWQKSGCEVVR